MSVTKLIAENRRARFDYFLDDFVECGIMLTGTEVKSCASAAPTSPSPTRRSKGGGIFLINADIPPYTGGNRFNHEPRRPRKLLLHRKQIDKLAQAVQREGLTLIPTKLYWNDKGLAKLEIGVAKGKKLHDKRATEQARDWKRCTLASALRGVLEAQGLVVYTICVRRRPSWLTTQFRWASAPCARTSATTYAALSKAPRLWSCLESSVLAELRAPARTTARPRGSNTAQGAQIVIADDFDQLPERYPGRDRRPRRLRILLDTNVGVWVVSEARLSDVAVQALIVEPENELVVSVVSLWEIVIKVRVGKLKADLGEIEQLLDQER
jgi:SsrA-binding protein